MGEGSSRRRHRERSGAGVWSTMVPHTSNAQEPWFQEAFDVSSTDSEPRQGWGGQVALWTGLPGERGTDGEGVCTGGGALPPPSDRMSRAGLACSPESLQRQTQGGDESE